MIRPAGSGFKYYFAFFAKWLATNHVWGYVLETKELKIN